MLTGIKSCAAPSAWRVVFGSRSARSCSEARPGARHLRGKDQLPMIWETASTRFGWAARVGRPASTQVTRVSPSSQKADRMSGSDTDAPLSALAPNPIRCTALRKFISAPPMQSHCSCAGTSARPRVPARDVRGLRFDLRGCHEIQYRCILGTCFWVHGPKGAILRTSGVELTATSTLDARGVAPGCRDGLILSTFRRLCVGESVQLVHDHEPKRLFFLLRAEMPEASPGCALRPGPRSGAYGSGVSPRGAPTASAAGPVAVAQERHHECL